MTRDDGETDSDWNLGLLAASGGMLVLLVVVSEPTTVESVTYGILAGALVLALATVVKKLR